MDKPQILAKIVIVLWVLTYSLSAMTGLLWLIFYGDGAVCDLLQIEVCPADTVNFSAAAHAILGGVLGAGTLGMVSFHKHVTVQNDFNLAHGWGYMFAPVLGGILGLVTFVLLQTGMLVLTGSSQSSGDAAASYLSYFAVGFLSGFGWVRATQQLNDMVARFFGGAGKGPRLAVPETISAPPADANEIRAPGAARVISIATASGQAVARGQSLLTLDGEDGVVILTASRAGIVQSMAVEPGADIAEDDLLLTLAEASEGAA